MSYYPTSATKTRYYPSNDAGATVPSTSTTITTAPAPSGIQTWPSALLWLFFILAILAVVAILIPFFKRAYRRQKIKGAIKRRFESDEDED
ncbi:MAG: hypothetical protein Sylvanvirus1_19 [Sylvanvirus sp.]|uniref:Uncharacterized protein n=1 Tax=Sylvanvirus sp. TaxID=2487774 RepID=A0A3G5AJZ0_9VIRU|nr:MAG: hypothetical protein Sylvanvirus1_19 [Sylvanvirus sp.]